MRMWLLAGVLGGAWGQVRMDGPLPPVEALRARALASYKASEAARERYICKEKIEDQELDGAGRVKKTSVAEREVFFVNGYEISQAVTRDGQALNAAEAKKRDEAVKKAIEAASDHKAPKQPGLVIRAGDILRLGNLTDERRVLVAGRPTIVFDVRGGKGGSSIEEKLVGAMEGTVSIDEATGNLQDVNTHGVRDVKVGGGLVADVHKGFAVHMVIAPEADGVWLLRTAEGTGGARVGLFYKAGVRFRQEMEGCRIYSVESRQSGDQAKGSEK